MSRALELLLALGLLSLAPLWPQEPAAGPVIRRNLFPRSSWIPDHALEAHLGLLPGSPYIPQAAADALRRLLAWEFVETAGPPEVVPVEGATVDLIWPVEVRPIVRAVRVDLRPPGRRAAIQANEILAGLRTREGRPRVKADLAADHEEVLEKYLQQGHLLAEVRVEEVPAGPGAVEVELRIEEGHRIAVSSIVVAGNDAVPRRHLRSVMKTQPRLLFGLLSSGTYDPLRFSEDLERIRELYRTRGHLEVRVVPESLRFSPDLSQVKLEIRVEEGPRYRLSRLRIEGNGPGVPTELLERQVRSRPGPYTGLTLEEDRQRLVRWYEEHYDRVPRIEVRHEFGLDPESREVVAILEIDEGVHFRAGRVDVEGNLRTRDRVVRSALTVLPSGPLTKIELEESARRLAGLGFFERSAVSAAEPAGRIRDVEVRVEERRTGLFEVGGGASTGEGEIGYMSLTQPNLDLLAIPGPRRRWRDAFSGGGQLLQLAYAPGTRQSELSFRFEEPYLGNTRHSLSARMATLFYDREGYHEGRLRGELGLRRFWDSRRRLSTGLGYVLEDVEISSISTGAPPDVTAARGHTALSYPTLRIAYQDLQIDPHSGPVGLLAEARGDAADDLFGSESSFLRAVLSADLSWPVTPWINAALPGEPLSDAPALRHVVRLGGRFGWMDGTDGDLTPIFERFFLGGPRSVRGFDYRGLGPESAGTPVGGEAFFQGTVEYSFPLVVPGFRGVLLFDFADLERELSELATRRIRTAAGGGLRIRSRFLGQTLPFDLYWVQALSKESGDDTRLFTFTIGLTF